MIRPLGLAGKAPIATLAITTPTAYWKLDEASGNFASQEGGYTLTKTGTATYSTGKKATSCPIFTADGTSYGSISGGTLPRTSVWSMCAWVMKTSNTNGTTSPSYLNDTVFGQGGSSDSGQWLVSALGLSGTDDDGNPFEKTFGLLKFNVNQYNSYTISPGNNVWCFISLVVEFSSSGTDDNGQPFVISNWRLRGNNSVSSDHTFTIGASPTWYVGRALAGRICEVGYWNNYALTSTEIGYLYNGNGTAAGATYTHGVGWTG